MGDFGVGAGGGKDKLGGIVTSFCWPGEWENIEEVGGGGFKDLGVHIFWTVGVHPKVEGLGVGDKLRNEWRERVHDKRCVAVGEVGLDGNGSGGNGSGWLWEHYWP